MKKTKLLTSILAVSSLSAGIMPLTMATSCSSSEQYNVELVSSKKEREFNGDSNASAWIFETNSVEDAKATKVKMINLTVDGAETNPVAGLVKVVHDSAGNVEVHVNTNVLLSQWPNGTTFKFDFEFTNKENNKTTTVTDFCLTFNPFLSVINFRVCEWSLLIKRINQYYNNEITLDEFIATFGNDDLEPFTRIENFYWKYKKININSVDHDVMIVGVEHDDIVDELTGQKTGKKALFTFKTKCQLFNSDGKELSCVWNNFEEGVEETYNYDYPNSPLRKNLTGQGDGVLKWYELGGAVSTETRTALEMIKDGEPTLFDALKTVNKKVATYDTESGEFVVSDAGYNDKIFAFTQTELSGSSGHSLVEGTKYEIFDAYTDSEDWKAIRQLDNLTAADDSFYWLSTPIIGSYAGAFCIDNFGNFDTQNGCDISKKHPVSFGFCI